jgi:DNA helicase-2/ATP-dependent DNA helicase PcrA
VPGDDELTTVLTMGPGPVALGRGVVVTAGGPVPEPWQGAPVVTVDEAALAEPGPTVARLHTHWAAREPVVVALSVDPARFRDPERWVVEPWTIGPEHEVWLDRLHFLVWANTYDARAGSVRWWWATKASRSGATPTPGGPADVTLPDGRPAWVDGGPRAPIAPDAVGGHAVVHADAVELGRLTTVPAPVAPSADLAADQLDAVGHGAGPARIIAPAGSGKTRVLTERLRHLIADRAYERESLLAVAYNVKARDEMAERTAGLGARIKTLNAWAYGLLAEVRGGAPPVIEEREVRRILDQLAPSRRPRANTDPLGPYLEALTTARLGLRDPDLVERERGDVPGFGEMFGGYRRELRRKGVVDFDEQVYAAVEALLADGELRRRVQASHRHLLVDELQDLTPAHILLVRLVAAPALDVFGVGDDDQTIYEHAGADPRFLIDYARLFPGAADHPLEVNYRCPVAVVDAASHLLSYNHRRVDKVIRPGPAADADPSAVTVRLDTATAAALVEELKGWLGDGVAPAQVAVLARVRSGLLAPLVALVEAGLPVRSIPLADVLERTGVRAALAYLRLATSEGSLDPDDLAEVYRRPSRGLPNWITKWFRRGLDVSGLEAIADKLDDAKAASKVEWLARDVTRVIEAARGGTTRRVLEEIRDGIGLGEAMEMLDRSKGGEGSSQLDDIDALIQVADLHPDPAGFEPWLRRLLRRDQPDDGITLSTVHRVKGREWDRVAVVGVTAGVMPHRLAESVEGERRVLHVAITRARHRTLLVGDETRPSPFLGELDGSAPHQPLVLQPPPTEPRAQATKKKAAPRDSLTEAAQEHVYDALAGWRKATATRIAKPAYVVLSNATLAAIAVKCPTSLVELSRIEGIGPAKLDLYGDELLELLDSLAERT